MRDHYGYYEMVIHPPPLNFLTIALLPFLINRDFIKKASLIFSKTMFWLENILFIPAFLLGEILWCPFIWFKVLFNITAMAEFVTFFPLFFMWIVIGPFYLAFSVCKDMFYFLKILCDY
jgi:hypothetical protein